MGWLIEAVNKKGEGAREHGGNAVLFQAIRSGSVSLDRPSHTTPPLHPLSHPASRQHPRGLIVIFILSFVHWEDTLTVKK